MRRPLTLLAAAVLAAGIQSGCAPSQVDRDPIDQIEVTGEVGGLPVVAFPTPLPLTETDSRILVEGEGTPLTEAGPLLLRATSYDGSDGTIESEGDILVLSYTEEDLGAELHAALAGQAEGSRVLVVQPVEGEVDKEMLVSIADVLPTRATGEQMDIPEGVPTLTLGERGEPALDNPSVDTVALRVIPTILGSGAQVAPGDQVVVQYSAWYEDGVSYDSTWAAGGVPAIISIDDVFPGLRDGLLDQRVGSQVMLLVPPEMALGTDPLLMVVDILAAYQPAER